MYRHRRNLLAIIVISACALERLEDEFNEHGLTYDTTGVASGDTTVGTSVAGDTSTTAAASMGGAEAGHDADSGGTSTTSTTTATTATTATDESTSGPQPVCGNGVLEQFGWVPEECDDGNLAPGDGCDDNCNADRVMFVTSAVYKAGDLKSLYLADALCANLALQAGFPQWLKFRVWLSDSTTSVRDRIEFSRGRIILVNGLVIADSWIDLLAGKLKNPIEVTEVGETYHGPVWTGTESHGIAIPDSKHCDDWSSSSYNKSAYYGYSDKITAEWTLSAAFDNPFGCDGDFAIYCIEQR